MSDNEYVAMMRDTAASMREWYPKDAAKWHAAAEAFEALEKACQSAKRALTEGMSSSDYCGAINECEEALRKAGADLRGADLRGAYLRGAYLRGADLRGADLRDAYLRGAKLAWQSHDLLAEILRRSAGDNTAKRKIAGLILVSRDKCWRDFLGMAEREPLADWALDELAKWVQEGDEDAPEILRERAKRVSGPNRESEAI